MSSFKHNIQKQLRAAFITSASNYNLDPSSGRFEHDTVHRKWIAMSPEMHKDCGGTHWLLDATQRNDPFPNIIHSPFGLCCQILKDELDFCYKRLDYSDTNPPLSKIDLINKYPQYLTNSEPQSCVFISCYDELLAWTLHDWDTKFDNDARNLYTEIKKLDEKELSTTQMLEVISVFYGIPLPDLIKIHENVVNPVTTGQEWMNALIHSMKTVQSIQTIDQLFLADLLP